MKRVVLCLFALALMAPACSLSDGDKKCQKIIQRGGKKLVKVVACGPEEQRRTSGQR